MQITNLFEVGGYQTAQEQLFGIECEVESLNTGEHWDLPHTIEVHEDGSLRNYGKEFITRPLNKEKTLEAFEQLHKGIKFYKPEQAFSQRTSIHVHMNCQPLDEAVVRKVVLFYALYEEAFFRMVDPSRRNNIHCVALTETFLTNHYRDTLRGMAARWSKYTALNLLPLKELGTIEFRHMQGHNDPNLLRQWLGVLDRLFVLARTTELSAATLNRANIVAWFSFLFGGCGPSFEPMLAQLDTLTQNSVLDIKLGLM